MSFFYKLLTVFLMVCAPPLLAQQVKVFTDSTIPVSNAGTAQVILLDQPRLLEQQLSAGLPGNQEQAEHTVLTRLQTPEGQGLYQQLIDAHMGVVSAWQLGITKLPAVVVDDKYVVYGQTDVGQAVATINRAKGVGGADNRLQTPSMQLPTR